MTEYAVIASNQSHSYDLFAPLTTAMWAKVVGFKTLCFLTDTAKEWDNPVGHVVKKALEEAGAVVHHIGVIQGYQNAQAAQSSRQHAAALDLAGDDILITADVDMMSMDREWFRQHDPARWDFTLYYSNAYGEKYPPFHCTPYVAATVSKWREVMQLEVRGEIGTQLQANFDRTLGRYHDSWLGWWHDELYYNSKLKAWNGYPDRCQMIPRQGQPPHDRIDRCAWPSSFDWSKKWVDTHLIRPGATPENWPRIRPILEHFIPEKMEWVDSYVRDYRKARYG